MKILKKRTRGIRIMNECAELESKHWKDTLKLGELKSRENENNNNNNNHNFR